ncbi:MAG: HNH endonuclease [Bacteroidota bacterium]
MSRLNGKQIQHAKEQCAERDGVQCNRKLGHGCGRKPPEVYLELDHIDGNIENNDRSNHQLLCRHCNRKKDSRGQGRGRKFFHFSDKIMSLRNKNRGKGPRRGKEKLLVQYVSMEKNLVSEPIVVVFIQETVGRLRLVEEVDLVNAAAEEVRKRTGRTISPQTVRIYLEKLCNPINGIFEYWKDGEDRWFVKIKGLEMSDDTTSE